MDKMIFSEYVWIGMTSEWVQYTYFDFWKIFLDLLEM
jgi:hypothetical protein